jgi:hypothetical protein
LLSFVSFAASLSCVALVSFVCAPEARAQTADLIGVRAQGMAGAFTAVADDSSATWWNPAGLASGAYFNAIIEYDRPRDPAGDAFGGFSVAFPALGLSYYRLPLSQMQTLASTGVVGGSRQDEGALSVYGASVGQSLGNHLVVGSTVKFLRAGESKGGLDLGAMASFGRARLGVMVRNATEAEFNKGTPDAWRLEREARAGLAYTSGARGAVGAATVAVDADLTTRHTLAGDERRVAFGTEVWTPRRSLGFRGGVSTNTIGEHSARLSGGLSASVRSGTFMDVHITGGGSNTDRRTWGVDLRVTF